MEFFKFFKGYGKEILKTAAIVGAGLTANEVLSTEANAKPVETAGHNLVVKNGLPSAEVDIQAGVDLMAVEDPDLQKKIAALTPDQKIRFEKIKERRLADLKEILEKKIQDSAVQADSDDDEGGVGRRRSGGKGPGDIRLQIINIDTIAYDKLMAEISEAERKASLTPEQKAQEKEEIKQAQLEVMKAEQKKNLDKLPADFKNQFYNEAEPRVMSGDQQKINDYELDLENFVNKLINNLDRKAKIRGGKLTEAEIKKILGETQSDFSGIADTTDEDVKYIAKKIEKAGLGK